MGANAQTRRSLPQYGNKNTAATILSGARQCSTSVSFPAHRKICVAETQACTPSGVVSLMHTVRQHLRFVL